ncbi:1-phosphofructokinase family hexose kinase [Fontisphaera persica]|uniref:1-phosphofructokinase family hexose kinase n=1 Tax=Fontisphaera persica TaxID=2974023 RepID=UPI0024C0AF02|nr:1-phosphofructokinase family hexose kinase [Fontisphaera persica]WCJ58395.1 1-phosphofructokinase family hexose kinase [Fontisphaera persica]
MILCLGPTPALQRVMRFARLQTQAVNRALETLDGIAGKAVNVAKVLRTLGETPLLTGFIGGETGRRLEAGLAQCGLRQEWVRVPAPTRQCITVVDMASGGVTELVEESRPVPAEAYDRLWDVVKTRLPQCRALIISGTLTPGAPTDFYARCVAAARQQGLLTVVDTQRDALRATLAARPTLVKPNRQELEALLEQPLPDAPAVARAMRHLQDQGAEAVLVTAGSGPALLSAEGRLWQLRPPAIAALNPIGSGDSLTAAMVSRRLRGEDWPEACRWGVAAGAANALTWMPGELEMPDLERLLAQAEVTAWEPPS